MNKKEDLLKSLEMMIELADLKPEIQHKLYVTQYEFISVLKLVYELLKETEEDQ